MSKPPDWETLFKSLATRPIQIALVCTGGGSGAIAKCFRRHGASRNFVDAAIPYSRAASASYLGAPPPGTYTSVEFAKGLAGVAFERADRLGNSGTDHAVGIALVATLPTEPPTDAKQQIHVALHQAGNQRSWSRDLAGQDQTRESAEQVADQMVFDAIASIIPPHDV